MFNRLLTAALCVAGFASVLSAQSHVTGTIKTTTDGINLDGLGENAYAGLGGVYVQGSKMIGTLTDHYGCAKAISTGISWVLSNVDEAIFLEDDCVAVPSFFPYCDDLLER